MLYRSLIYDIACTLYIQTEPLEPPELSPMVEGDELAEFDEESTGAGFADSQRQTVDQNVMI